MSDLAFTDTHVHFYDMCDPQLRYSWLQSGGDPEETEVLGDYGAIRSERYWPEDFLSEARFQKLERVVHVQAAIGTVDPVEETRWLQEAHRRTGIPHGAVGYADLADPSLRATLERHGQFDIFRGIRDLRYDGYLSEPRWERGFALLGSLGLVSCQDPPLGQVPFAAKLARRHPETAFCIDHALMPRRRDPEYFKYWRECIRTLADVPSIVIKISGLGMCDHKWTVESLRPWVLECIDAFGVKRAFFGTNWPVDRLYSSYGDLVEAYAQIIADFSVAEQRLLFSENAKRIFKLG